MKKIVYLAHPIAGAVRLNISRIEQILEAVLKRRGRHWPIAPYLDACRYLDDSGTDRDAAFRVNKRIFDSGLIDELWVCGQVSDGVRAEIQWAIEAGIDVVFKNYEELVE